MWQEGWRGLETLRPHPPARPPSAAKAELGHVYPLEEQWEGKTGEEGTASPEDGPSTPLPLGYRAGHLAAHPGQDVSLPTSRKTWPETGGTGRQGGGREQPQLEREGCPRAGGLLVSVDGTLRDGAHHSEGQLARSASLTPCTHRG